MNLKPGKIKSSFDLFRGIDRDNWEQNQIRLTPEAALFRACLGSASFNQAIGFIDLVAPEHDQKGRIIIHAIRQAAVAFSPDFPMAGMVGGGEQLLPAFFDALAATRMLTLEFPDVELNLIDHPDLGTSVAQDPITNEMWNRFISFCGGENLERPEDFSSLGALPPSDQAPVCWQWTKGKEGPVMQTIRAFLGLGQFGLPNHQEMQGIRGDRKYPWGDEEPTVEHAHWQDPNCEGRIQSAERVTRGAAFSLPSVAGEADVGHFAGSSMQRIYQSKLGTVPVDSECLKGVNSRGLRHLSGNVSEPSLDSDSGEVRLWGGGFNTKEASDLESTSNVVIPEPPNLVASLAYFFTGLRPIDSLGE